jgi:thymidylate synthase (FAD)
VDQQIQVELQESLGSDRSIALSAWTSSYDKTKREEKTDEDVEKVVKMMAESGHGTPFESVVFRFWIKLPIFSDRQHMTHRIASHNGMSGRYRTMPDEWYKLPSDVTQIIYKGIGGHFDSPESAANTLDKYEELCRGAYEFYNSNLNYLKKAEKKRLITNEEYKRVREVLRGVLPISGMTERTTLMNLRSFANYQRLRNSSHAQPEIKRVAELMLEQVKNKNICPIALEALEKQGWRI